MKARARIRTAAFPVDSPERKKRPVTLRRRQAVVSVSPCSHITSVTAVRPPERRECAECVKTDARWVHLRTCQECGVTLCCDSSPHRHASGHARAAEHPVIASAEPGERWLYCYQDDVASGY
jgi:uncharacterized UBP type Zn finger protein